MCPKHIIFKGLSQVFIHSFSQSPYSKKSHGKRVFFWYNLNMELTSALVVKELVSKHGIKPSKRMGQHFLIDSLMLENIIKVADVSATDTVIEIGPGIGTLTRALAQKAGKVIAIEKDHAMIEILKETLQDVNNVQVVKNDALQYDIPLKKYKVVANIPYYLTSAIIRKFLEHKTQPEAMVLMVQKEVAQRICANPPHMSILAVSVQFYATAKITKYVSKECFWPRPNVDSAIIEIIPHGKKESVRPELFFQVVKAGFLQPRKQLVNNFSKAFKKDLPAQTGKKEVTAWLLKNSINPLQRAETLSVQNWEALTLHLPDLD